MQPLWKPVWRFLKKLKIELPRKGESVSRSVVPMWSIACKAPLSMEFSRQEYWTEQSFPSLGDLPNPGIEPRSCALQVDLLPFESPGKPIGGNVNWYSHCGKQYGGFSKKKRK